MGPCSSTFLSSDDVSEFHFLVGLLSLHIPMAPHPAKENYSTIKRYMRAGLDGQWWEWVVNSPWVATHATVPDRYLQNRWGGTDEAELDDQDINNNQPQGYISRAKHVGRHCYAYCKE